MRLLERDLPKPVGRDLAAIGEAHADLITRDQYAIRALRTNNRIIVNGGPGTGKTWLAMEHARQETLRGARGRRPVLQPRARHLAAGRGLDVAAGAAAGVRRHLPSAGAGLVAATTVPTPLPDGFWDELAGRLAEAADARDEADRFDLVIVDEGQDYREEWWPVVAKVLADPDDGPLVVFRDDDQTVPPWTRGGRCHGRPPRSN